MSVNRREFLAGAGALLIAGPAMGAGEKTLRAAIIGHTGKGDYGHGLDLVFQALPGVELVALADADDTGRAKAAKRCNAQRHYADWRLMLEKEQPRLVCVAPRQTGERREMLLAAVAAGAHIFCEKPFVRSPADGDLVLEQARQKNLKVTVSHQMRLAPAVVHLKKKVGEGLLGDLLEMHAWGKQDRRAGGEDMAVLGIHLFDLMRMFAGEPEWCTARVLEKNRPATAEDAKQASEDLGKVLGSDINAQFSFAQGVLGTFTSRPGLRDDVGHWGLELVGAKGAARILADIWPMVFVKHPGKWEDAGRTDAWRRIDDDPSAKAPEAQRSIQLANRRLADDWLAAIAENREPVCSGQNAAKAVEMSMGVWRAGLAGGRISFPLKDRRHVLGD